MDLCSDPFLARRPDLSAVILDDLLYDRKSDAASALAGISRRISPVEPVKDVRKLLLADPLSIILDLDLDKITDIKDPDIDDPMLFCPYISMNFR